MRFNAVSKRGSKVEMPVSTAFQRNKKLPFQKGCRYLFGYLLDKKLGILGRLGHKKALRVYL